ncbi:MAG: hypothetical protein PF904_21460 [Kiritimatiellae bacterium]|nr:hypothetical protein [Kiritimatiellia bacterium]
MRQEARSKPEIVQHGGFGKSRDFYGCDWGCDTFIFEKDIWKNLENHAPVLIVKKSDILKGTHGYIFTLTTGNHSVALHPLALGSFWNLGSLSSKRRQHIISHCVLCANVINGKLEISQRDVDATRVTDADYWLQSLGFRLNEIVFADRNSNTLEIYRRLGQEWRIKPLAWTQNEMRAAINHSYTAINSKLKYYHSSTGVHFLTYDGLRKLLYLFENDYGEFIVALKELVFVYIGQNSSNLRTEKINNHHEIELFGLHVGSAETVVIPQLEQLMDLITHKKLNINGIKRVIHEVLVSFKMHLERPELADSTSIDFIETMYIHLSGEIYHLNTNGVSAAFDARRIALPGATFRGDQPDFHQEVDRRSKVLIYNIEQLLSNEERMEYLNVYELRKGSTVEVGKADTREIVFKTNRRPLCTSLIEKRLASQNPGYGSYLLARVHAFKSLGINIGEYRLLTRLDSSGRRRMHFFLRNRCPGEPLEYVKPKLFNNKNMNEESYAETKNIILALASLLGNAAAQNLIMKKYITSTKSCRFGEGKEIFKMGFNAQTGTEVPESVSMCSMRGAIGWPDLSYTDENLDAASNCYLNKFASVLVDFHDEYQSIVSLKECADCFMVGFDCKTKEIYWNYMVNKEAFDSFNPQLNRRYGFIKKWRFVLWALEQQHSRLELIHKLFIHKVKISFDEK